ncbi:hypothetical protein VK70_04470 [Paenibacillus durus ATCC 35681]|uniref:YD repeat-containing protein n=2 Tax=Paenibacillus durus TaxID=44251 RepID=A0A0F7F892_PAEDU|nr:hypothetical protein VK70_04470 [Paenibacillus durus ATCC 35681]
MGVVIAVLVLSGLTSISASAVQYGYDGLDRLTTAEDDSGQMTQYQYDAAGNLLSVLTTANLAQMKSANLSGAASEVWEGWTPYSTADVNAQYHLIENMSITDAVYGSVPEPTVTADVYIETGQSDSYLVQQISADTSRAGGANVYKDIRITGSQSYSIAGWIEGEQLQHAAAQAIVNYYDASGRLIGHENAANVLESSNWSHFDKILSPPGNAVKARVHLQLLLLEADGSGTARFAEITFEPYKAAE